MTRTELQEAIRVLGELATTLDQQQTSARNSEEMWREQARKEAQEQQRLQHYKQAVANTLMDYSRQLARFDDETRAEKEREVARDDFPF